MSNNITVITASYNSYKYLRDTVISIANQTLMPKEHLIIDDCSTDDSLVLAKQLAKEFSHVRVIEHENNKGFPSALNTGIDASETKYVAILDSDDIAFKDWLKTCSSIMDNDDGIGATGCGGIIITETGEITGGGYFSGRDDTRVKLSRNPFSHPGTVWRKSILEQYGSYDQTMHGWEDTEIFMRVAPYTKLIHVDENLIFYRRRASSLSAKMRTIWPDLRVCLLTRYEYQINGDSIEEANNKVKPLFEAMRQKIKNNHSRIPAGQYDFDIAQAFKDGKKCIKATKHYMLAIFKGVKIYQCLKGCLRCYTPNSLVKFFKNLLQH